MCGNSGDRLTIHVVLVILHTPHPGSRYRLWLLPEGVATGAVEFFFFIRQGRLRHNETHVARHWADHARSLKLALGIPLFFRGNAEDIVETR